MAAEYSGVGDSVKLKMNFVPSKSKIKEKLCANIFPIFTSVLFVAVISWLIVINIDVQTLREENKNLREENESLRITQRDSSAEIIELRAAIESMDGDAGEVNRLSAEVANLKYELDAKNAELRGKENELLEFKVLIFIFMQFLTILFRVKPER